MSNNAVISTYTVSGMSCGSCVGKVRAEVGKLSGIESVDIELATGRMTVAGTVTEALIQDTVENLGYEIVRG
ncbi:heavy-metal-associated domain-containing protein [Nocardia cyriacigeorgica]|uniref:Heavy-metal-associated domain-containing protein n=1 Tax=Nocardia cyriacigeorgica TaxID=135487 RepID=A0A6P1D147_9NOCA|nr:heavy metal-associated domain-containing protein [Nocardia cyriacigeorgica]NEW42233.1 heavy-metal-associated domain-containing protein [Nocardia cyriacigeorgica]NEW44206.1 heavy-metal-associated domain-containing protein [Nocardia cyriacigeorgica]NEW51297.1 heavy-metal-associated domain-containing protein [Nocardia cyriacigeorgica]NEW56936.1 heavy-metal-associated domain-containing protein [Nocardia cyriacigeorgica]